MILNLRPSDFLQFVLLVEEALLALGQQQLVEQPQLPTQPAQPQGRLWGSGRYRASLN